KLLRKLPTEGPRVLMGPGENADAVDAGDGLAVVFKVESHNHPSAVEPFQGAATGVGGILRDVFAIGARPVAVLDSLRFGDPDTARTRYLLERVVAGIAGYGNSVGVATVGGEIYFESPYEQNCLVNAMCVGLARKDTLVRPARAGDGARRGDDLRVPGADAVRRRARPAGRSARGLRALGDARDPDRIGHGHGEVARVGRRRAGRRHAGRGAGRRVPALRPRA